MPETTSSQPARRATYLPFPSSSPRPPYNPPSSASSTTPLASPSTTNRSTSAHQAAPQQYPQPEDAIAALRGEERGSGWPDDSTAGRTAGSGSGATDGWSDEMEEWGGASDGSAGPDWTAWVLDDEVRYPPLARARHAGLHAVLNIIKRHLSAAKDHAADVLSWEETVAAEEAVQLWELFDDVAVRVTSTALDSIRRERAAQDARFVADGGPRLHPHRPFP
ncbi:hypothetical protein JCM8097_008587 [Rhodosporidiobolus ruineniae]